MMRKKSPVIILSLLSRVTLLVALFLFATSPIAWIYDDNLWSFIIPGAISLSLGLVLHFSTRKIKPELNQHEAFITVTSAWVLLSILGALPYLISGSIPAPADALFESISGFTTTGSSILTEIESLPKSILFWRSLTHWIGGLGIIVLVIIIMPTLNIGSYQLFTTESSFTEKIHPKMVSVGRRLLIIYIGLTLAETIALLLGGMNLFESVCHAFGTIATGGFSPKNDSIAGYSPYLQYVVMIFMLLSGMNFLIHYYMLKFKINKIRKNDEFRFFLMMVFLAGAVTTMVLVLKADYAFEKAFREAFFQVISIITCTGYATADYLLWPQFLWVFIFLLMFLGGSTGSTSGGIKMARHLVMFKSFGHTIKNMVHPNLVAVTRLNGKTLSFKNMNSILTFIILYIAVFVIGSLLLMAMGVDANTSLGSAATTMGGIGPGIGSVGPASNFAHLPVLAKSLLMLLMLLGRLELYAILSLFTPAFWKV